MLDLLKQEREKYEQFFKAFGLQLKYGVYSEYGAHKDLLQDLLLFYSSKEQKLVTLDEYRGRMPENQKFIFYATGESVQRVERLPQTELVKDKGFEILYLTDDVDEFALRTLHAYKDKEFKSVSSGDLGLENEDEKEAEKQAENYKELFRFMQDSLEGKVKEVRLSTRLKSHPVCLTSDGALSLEMEKILNALPQEQKVKAERLLEINGNHPILNKLNQLYMEDQDKLKAYSELLYAQALLIEGLSIEDPVAFSNLLSELMTEKVAEPKVAEPIQSDVSDG